MNVNEENPIDQGPNPAGGFRLEFDQVMLAWAAASLFVTLFFIPDMVCSCGYLTPGTLPETGGAAIFAWIPFAIPGRKHWVTRLLLIVAVIFATAVFGRNLADVLWLSPHAGNWSH